MLNIIFALKTKKPPHGGFFVFAISCLFYRDMDIIDYLVYQEYIINLTQSSVIYSSATPPLIRSR